MSTPPVVVLRASSPESRSKAMMTLVLDAERRYGDLALMMAQCANTAAALPPSQMKEKERALAQLEFRHKLLKRMKQGLDLASEFGVFVLSKCVHGLRLESVCVARTSACPQQASRIWWAHPIWRGKQWELK